MMNEMKGRRSQSYELVILDKFAHVLIVADDEYQKCRVSL